jgi:hypothetical protein
MWLRGKVQSKDSVQPFNGMVDISPLTNATPKMLELIVQFLSLSRRLPRTRAVSSSMPPRYCLLSSIGFYLQARMIIYSVYSPKQMLSLHLSITCCLQQDVTCSHVPKHHSLQAAKIFSEACPSIWLPSESSALTCSI